MGSYQKNGDVDTTNGSNGTTKPSSGGGLLSGWKKYVAGVVLIALLAFGYTKFQGPTPEATKANVKKEMEASDLTFGKDGKLKLFDSFSKFYLL